MGCCCPHSSGSLRCFRWKGIFVVGPTYDGARLNTHQCHATKLGTGISLHIICISFLPLLSPTATANRQLGRLALLTSYQQFGDYNQYSRIPPANSLRRQPLNNTFVCTTVIHFYSQHWLFFYMLSCLRGHRWWQSSLVFAEVLASSWCTHSQTRRHLFTVAANPEGLIVLRRSLCKQT